MLYMLLMRMLYQRNLARINKVAICMGGMQCSLSFVLHFEALLFI